MLIPTKEFIEIFKKTEGAFSVSESIALMNITSTVISGNYIEAGSNAGKSGMSAAYGLPKGKFYMIDPIYDLKNFEAWEHTIQKHPDNLAWKYADEKDFKDKVKLRILFASDNRVEPILLGSYSEKELPLHGKYSFAFIDSDNHQHERVFAEIGILEDLMIAGGIIAFHDFGNQYIAPRQAHEQLIATGKYENVEINWQEIFDYVRENNLEEGNNSWHEKGSEEFPKFVGAVKRT
jgi:predicted O-methyltransferase YrrM